MHLIYDDLFLDHVQGYGHPESPERLMGIKSAMESKGLWIEPEKFQDYPIELLQRVHHPDYIEMLKQRPAGRLDPDTMWHANTYEIAMLALKGAYTGAKRTMETDEPSMCLLRPPGHHAGSDYFGGFCYYNNAALIAETALDNGAQKVAIVDIDVHHGNGTRDIFAKRKDVLYISTHQWGIYPGTGPIADVGEGEGEGYTINLALPSGSGDSTFKSAFEKVVLPALEQFDPGFLVVSIGGDAHYMDPLASLSLSTPGYLHLCKELNDLAKRTCNGKIAYVLEGGYDIRALGDVMSGLAAMLQHTNNPDCLFDMVKDASELGKETVDEVVDVQSKYWSL